MGRKPYELTIQELARAGKNAAREASLNAAKAGLKSPGGPVEVIQPTARTAEPPRVKPKKRARAGS